MGGGAIRGLLGRPTATSRPDPVVNMLTGGLALVGEVIGREIPFLRSFLCCSGFEDANLLAKMRLWRARRDFETWVKASLGDGRAGKDSLFRLEPLWLSCVGGGGKYGTDMVEMQYVSDYSFG